MKMELNGFLLRMPLNSLEVLEEHQAFLFKALNHYLKEISAVPS